MVIITIATNVVTYLYVTGNCSLFIYYFNYKHIYCAIRARNNICSKFVRVVDKT